MGFHRQAIASPSKIGEAIDELLEGDLRKEEREQLGAAVAVVPQLAPLVSKRESMMISISGHADPGADGFDARNVSITISRVDPASAALLQEEAERRLKQADDAEAAAAEARRYADEATKTANA